MLEHSQLKSFDAHIVMADVGSKEHCMWLQGIRTYLAVNDSAVVAAKQQEAMVFQETWEYFADDQQLKALHPGDTRAALAPFLAHQVTSGLVHSYSSHTFMITEAGVWDSETH